MNIYGNTADGNRNACNFSSKVCASSPTYFHPHSKWGVNFSERPPHNIANALSDGPAVECSLRGQETWSGFGLRTTQIDKNRIEKVKLKCTLVQALSLCTGRTAHRESRGIALLFLDHGTRKG